MSTNEWTTLTVATVDGWSTIHGDGQADSDWTAHTSPVVLLQQKADGSRRVVFAAVAGVELVPADQVDGCIGVARTKEWQTAYSLGSTMRINRIPGKELP